MERENTVTVMAGAGAGFTTRHVGFRLPPPIYTIGALTWVCGSHGVVDSNYPSHAAQKIGLLQFEPRP